MFDSHKENVDLPESIGWTSVFASEATFFVILVNFWAGGAVPDAALRKYLFYVLNCSLLNHFNSQYFLGHMSHGILHAQQVLRMARILWITCQGLLIHIHCYYLPRNHWRSWAKGLRA